ncbi:SusC/RagA family TonB-linked outer membrane protein [Parafilimonas sp.]|uniref:SusC/RagA family TonB-linked outer membrane protein n=1 Tax=Parafilimonas sp. TaxID=1969739 RepID=UPI0039E565B6
MRRLRNEGCRIKRSAYVKRYCLIVCFAAVFSIPSFCQQLVTGKVIGQDSAALAGVSVRIMGSKIGTQTDHNGNFRIDVASGSTLIFSYIGFVTQEISVGSQHDITVVLQSTAQNLSDVVVVGYGTQKKTSLTASVSAIKGTEIQRQPVSDISNALGGRVSGVLFTQGSGQAGNDAATIMIRGMGTNGSASPLLIVDGVPRNYSQLNPDDIESISILKDAAAVAPYGMGGANGVILVTTKRGKSGKPVLSYDGYVGIQNPTVITHFVNSYQYATLKNVAAVNAGATIMPFTDDDLQKYKDGSDPDGHPNFDAIADMIQKNYLQTGHNLSISGGSDIIKYAAGLSYFAQDGMFPGIKYKRYNVSGNMDIQATNTTLVSLSLNGRVEQRNLSGAGYNTQSLFENLINTTSVSTPKIYSNGDHPYLYAYFYDNPSYQTITGNTMLTQFSIEQKLPLKGLSVKVVGAYDYNPSDPYNSDNAGITSLIRSWSAPFSYSQYDTVSKTYTVIEPTTSPSYYEEYHQTQAFTYQGYINYSGSFGKNAITGLVVGEARSTKSLMFSAGRINYNLSIPELFAGGTGSTDISNSGSSSGSKQRSLVYRLTYGYDNKYLFEATGRYDGHYYFAPGHRFGFFPAFSAAWRISQENFMADVKWLDELKIRGSWGQSGNLAGSAFQYLSGFTLYGTSAILDETQTQGLYENTEPNPNITWEKATKTDIGIEARFLNNAISLEADYFHERRGNMLLTPDVVVPAEYGISLAEENAGIMVNNGFEISINGNYSFSKDLRIGLSANFSYARNKLVQIFENSSTYDYPNLRQTGRPLNTPFGYKAIGYFTDDNFTSAGALKDGIPTQTWATVAPGDIRYADISGADGVPDGTINSYDMVPLGPPNYPEIIYGFTPSISYKGFELSLLFQGAGQRSLQITNTAAWAFDNNKNAPVTVLNYWTEDNPHASYPRMTTTPSENNTQTSSFWQQNLSYLRLRTGVLGYTLPQTFSGKLGMSLINVYVSGQNILTWTTVKNFDPEISNGRGWYFPTQKVITFGLKLQF